MSPGLAVAAANGRAESRPADRIALFTAIGLTALGAVLIAVAASARNAALLLLGSLLGIALYHAAFGFSAGWRAFLTDRQSAGLRAQLLLLAAASVLCVPAIAAGAALGIPVAGFFVPIGTSLICGAVLFGLGMQLGGGCGSGTLFTVGGGSLRMLITLAAFITGSTLGVAHGPAWAALPALAPVDLAAWMGAGPAVAAQLAAMAGIAVLVTTAERRRHGTAAPIFAPPGAARLGWSRLLRGPWPAGWGALALAALAFAVLIVAGRPWGITFAFGLWGSKILAALGVDVAAWPAWSDPGYREILQASVLADSTSVMDFGLVLGAMIAAALAGRFAPQADLRRGSVAAAILGGLLMGYGARLSSGCNIGALLGGIASGSLHGWVWFACAFLGTIIGVRARGMFGLRP